MLLPWYVKGCLHKEELKTIAENNRNDSLDASQKLIKGTIQYESYRDALKEIQDTTVQNANHTYAKTFSFSKVNSFILVDQDIEILTNLLSDVLQSSLSLQTETVVSSAYDLGNAENIKDFFE